MATLKIKEESKDYYLKFNIPLQIITLIGLVFLDYSWSLILAWSLFFHLIIYWLGIQCGSHKLFSHRSWEPKFNWIKYGIAYISCFGMMGGPIVWTAMHRWHHKHSDTDSDPHSPKDGLLHSYFMWFLNVPNIPLRLIKDHLSDQMLVDIDINAKKIVLYTLVVLCFVNYQIALALLLAMTFTFHIEMAINCFAHRKINNEWVPINYVWLGFLTGGSSLHANHHAHQGNSSFSTKWYEFDPTSWIIKILEKNKK